MHGEAEIAVGDGGATGAGPSHGQSIADETQ